MTLEWRPLRPGETDHETLWASVALALGILLVCWVRVVEWPPVLCPFHAITGLALPHVWLDARSVRLPGGRPPRPFA